MIVGNCIDEAVLRVAYRVVDPIRNAVYREQGLETFCPTTLGANLIRDYFIDGVNRGAAQETANPAARTS